MKKTPKNSGFKTPEGYFEGVTDRILDRIKNEEGAGIPEKDGFTIPEGYMDTMQKEVLTKVKASETPVISLHPYRKHLLVAASIAAIFVLVIGLQWNDAQSITFDDLANADIETYFESREIGFTSYEIAEVIPVNTIDLNEFMETGVNDENIMEYLEDSIDDIEELNLELDEEYQ
ncbi:MAG: hypothetical protein HKN52_01905 [Eudoraea sp.]|nr:hypothetical protein [Muriicola sp.]NNE01893.1 hypothetical protein [Eudoraea sp.]NNL02573.1 hypothetical protein [Eudoraea sp.]